MTRSWVFTACLAMAAAPAVAADKPLPLGDWLTLSGWTAARLAEVGADWPPTPEVRRDLADLAERFRRLPDRLLNEATRPPDDPAVVIRPGDVVALRGEVVTATRGDAATAEVLLQPETAAAGVRVTTLAAPAAWLAADAEPSGQPAEARGLVVAWNDDLRLVVTPRIRWTPTTADGGTVNYGEALLGTAGFDVGLLDDLADGRPLGAAEAAPFYGCLSAIQSYRPRQLLRAAGENLPRYAARWAEVATAGGAKQRLAALTVQRAEEGHYSVAPLFNDAVNQRGQLMAFEGVARRAVRIDLSLDRNGLPSRVPERYGLDHYYEVEVFPPDSQNLPLVFCVLELPTGFPVGDSIQEPVRVAGFFLKRWAYRTRKPGGEAGADDLRQLAPLLVGSGPVWLPTPQPSRGSLGQLWAGAAFVAVLLAIAFALRRQSFADEQFERSTLARLKAAAAEADASPPTGESGPGAGGSSGTD
ncbi:MAG: hypothetical protein AAGG46_04345 [Planctomycetota bacterium]